ncbi:hypothetical protein M501DRAFT_1013538 [Patellaria atrata CBS 101060]|uniref:Ankyrin repeat protein n=1 Tax=Patellaria atrata CBS 101060 TaxID=1346257 RepID=A0A9P4SH19_9PEZI|nr:hypothetical protein M501DRAFT_1013538 [Patellaria atrata CBS 101060]
MVNAQVAPTIDRLLNLVPDSPEQVLSHLNSHPELASRQDSHGYSLLHAAVSYGQIQLICALIQTHHVSPNIADEDNETPLFAAEDVNVAKTLVELGADLNWKNQEGTTAEEKIEAEEEWPLVAAYLRSSDARNGSSSNLMGGSSSSNGLHAPPPLPDNVKINVGSVEEQGEDSLAPDPEFRRKIEELAAREDFQTEDGQKALRDLVTEAVSGIGADEQNRDVRRRVA